MFALGAQRRRTSKKAAAAKATKRKREPGVVDADNRIVFVVLAVGMLVGALLTTPAKPTKHAELKTPAQANAAAGR
jgi:hypothetical protein